MILLFPSCNVLKTEPDGLIEWTLSTVWLFEQFDSGFVLVQVV